MAEAKSAPPSKSSDKQKSSDTEHVHEGEEAQQAGYWGTRDNAFADEEFSLTTGPDAPVTDAHGNPVDPKNLDDGPKESEK
jgi:hypothetical protein